ncbi:MAG: IF-2-associated domain-containing protein, partial [Alphaproteobacteria bacterium]|nr:IF-2-associated domain-containing protein [Alphaproteobacteria bacterium]
MNDANEQQQNVSEQEQKRPLTLGRGGGRLELRKSVETAQVRQSFSHGRSKAVTVEVRKKRTLAPGAAETNRGEPSPAPREQPSARSPATEPARRAAVLPRALT